MTDIFGSSQDDILTTSEDQVNIFGLDGNDTLTAMGDFNKLIGGPGADQLIGKIGGRTWASYETSATGVTLHVESSSKDNFGGDALGDEYTNIFLFQGSNYSDTFKVTANDKGTYYINGGDGFDIVDYTNSNEKIVAFANYGIMHDPYANNGLCRVDHFENIEKIIATKFNDIVDASGEYDVDGGDGIDTLRMWSENKGINISINPDNSITYNNKQYTTFEIIQGSFYADTITGNAQDNNFIDYFNDDTIDGAGGIDTVLFDNPSTTSIKVNLQENTAFYNDQYRTTLYNIENIKIFRGDGRISNDIIIGDANNNKLEAGPGYDTLIGGDGADTLDGGADFDIVSYSDSSSGVILNFATGINSGAALGDVLIDIEKVVGSRFDDQFIANSTTSSFDGGEGYDIVSFAAMKSGVSIHSGATSDNREPLYSNIEIFQGSSFDDDLSGANENNIFIGGAGKDTIYGGGESDTAWYKNSPAGVQVNLLTGLGAKGDAAGDQLRRIENIWGSSHADLLLGDCSENLLAGGDGNDTIYGGDGDDAIFGDSFDITGLNPNSPSAQADLLYAGPGNDQITTAEHDAGSIVYGQEGNDTIMVTDATAYGGDGNDFLASQGGSKLYGGQGDDSYLINTYNALAIEGKQSGFDKITTHLASYTLPENVERLIIDNSANSKAIGNASNNLLETSSGNDFISGGDGNDTLCGNAGADTLDGGDGIDTVWYINSQASVQINLASHSASGQDAKGDVLISIENVVGSKLSDLLLGDAQNNDLQGSGGNDTIYSGTGNDTIWGGNQSSEFLIDSGSSTIQADLIFAGPGDDVVYSNMLDSGTIVYGQSGADIISVYSGKAFGGEGNDRLIANDSGAQLYGESGNDILIDGNGPTKLDGGDGIDAVWYFQSASAVTINLAAHTSSGGAAGDTLISIENVTGSNSNDLLIGDAQDNLLQGGAGSDTIYGGAGNDTIYGGVGDAGGPIVQGEVIQADLIYAGPGDDIVITNTGDIRTMIFGQDGADRISGYFGKADGGNGDDVLISKGMFATLIGGNGNDVLTTYSASKLDGGEGSDKFEVRAASQVEIEDHGTVGIDVVYLFNIATASDIATFRVNNDLLITDSKDNPDGHNYSGVLLPNWYGSNSNSIEVFIVGDGSTLSFSH